MQRTCNAVGWSIFLLLALPLIFTDTTPAADTRAGERNTMVAEQIVARGVKDNTTLAAMRSVPRHLFVPTAQSLFAYHDRPLPIGHGQTISQPYIVAYMTELISPGSGQKILEIGTGSGYQAAILAATGADVFTIEIIPELADSAAETLMETGYDQVKVKSADGFYGWPEEAPFDAIIVTAAAEFIPPPLIKQLDEGGLMVIPVGSPYHIQTLMLVQKRDGKPRSANLMPVRFVPFTRASE